MKTKGDHIQVGELNHRITFESASVSTDGMGGITPSWSTNVTLWANVSVLKGKELDEIEGTKGKVYVKCILRYTSAVNDDDRMVFNGENYEIISVLQEDLDKFKTVIYAVKETS